VLYISHFLEEVLQLAHRVTVLRDGGTVVDGGAVGSVNLDSLVTAMLGAAAHEPRAAERARASTGDGTAPVVRFDSVDAGTLLQRVSFDVPAGQIAGLTGLQGAGHLAALEVLTGRRRPDAGIVRVAGRTRPRSLRRAIRGGIAFVSSDRKRYGLMLDKPVWLNVSAVSWLGIGRNGPWLRQRRLTEEARRQTDRLRVAGGPLAITADLSGGNQQKVVFAKWLTAEPDVVVLDDPTRGVDVGARLEMHEIINAVAAEGRTVLLASTDLTELSQLCHRVLVFQRGRLVADLDREELSEQAMSVAMNAGFIEADPA
jgi:ABC-type sugar transport system ATPase subunit